MSVQQSLMLLEKYQKNTFEPLLSFCGFLRVSVVSFLRGYRRNLLF